MVSSCRLPSDQSIDQARFDVQSTGKFLRKPTGQKRHPTGTQRVRPDQPQPAYRERISMIAEHQEILLNQSIKPPYFIIQYLKIHV